MPRGVYDRSKAKAKEDDVAGKTTEEQAPDAAEPEVSAPETADVEQPCAEHFPDGWPDGVTSAGCVDGMWVRDLPED